jgi:hypothetical protein
VQVANPIVPRRVAAEAVVLLFAVAAAGRKTALHRLPLD